MTTILGYTYLTTMNKIFVRVSDERNRNFFQFFFDLMFQLFIVFKTERIHFILNMTPQKKSQIVRSGDLAGQGIGPPLPIQRLFKF